MSIFERDYNFTVATDESAFPIFSEPDSSVDTGAGRTEIYRLASEDFIEQLLDDSAPLQSHYEGTCEGKFQVCALDCDAYDLLMCEAAVL